LIKRFDSNWAVLAENDAATDYIKVGTSKIRPTYKEADAMLEDKGISLKYACDIGLAPKL
jgi:NCAIR mutase (PurE)-related protein